MGRGRDEGCLIGGGSEGDSGTDGVPGRRRVSPLATPSATREVLERHGLFTKYGLGQNFLVNDDVVRKILELAQVGPGDRVLEVGPGIGTLTYGLLSRGGSVVAIEKDADLPAVLADTLQEFNGSFTLLSMDALDLKGWPPDGGMLAIGGSSPESAELSQGFDGDSQEPDGVALDSGAFLRELDDDSQESNAGAPESDRLAVAPNKMVANLPYAVAATVVLEYLQRLDSLESATVMVQKEVADRMAAKPGSKTYGAYTVKLGLVAQPAGRFPVAPGNFFPPPRVESAVLRLNRCVACDENDRPLSPELLAATCTMADAAFATRRKTLANSCKTYFASQPEVAARLPRMFEEAAIDPRRRGETLTQPEFIRLGQALAQLRQ